MSLLTENIIPGDHGKVFGTNAIHESDLEKIKNKICSLKGIKNVIINTQVFPREFTIHTTSLVRVEDVEQKVISAGFHAIPKGLFKL